jgi:hypothetical protein
MSNMASACAAVNVGRVAISESDAPSGAFFEDIRNY